MKTLDFLKDSKQSWMNLLALCISWAAVLILFQDFVVARLKLARPDRSLSWTTAATQEDPFEKHILKVRGFTVSILISMWHGILVFFFPLPLQAMMIRLWRG